MKTRREELEAALAKAEAALASAVINSAKVGVDRDKASVELEKARGYCREAHAALVKLNRSGSISSTGERGDALIKELTERIDILIKQLAEVSNPGATASPPSRPISEHAVRGENKRPQDESRQAKSFYRLNRFLGASVWLHKEKRPSPSLLRQAIGLSGLTLAYLQYYFLDVQLQISRLPSIFS